MDSILLFKERGISGAWRSRLRKAVKTIAGHVRKMCVKTLFTSENTFISNFVAFFVLLGITFSCIRKISSSFTSATRRFTSAIVPLSTSRGHCPLARDGEPIRLLEIQTSLSLNLLIIIIIINNIIFCVSITFLV